ncbi:MAG: hypothetical protein O9340_05230 [Cyclobacteriaceae bacterium]|jgi:hypothetical protein|nr:hypothetical protein [Cyclobacteriaceae bacterium]
MKYSVVLSNNNIYRITIASSTDEERKLLKKPKEKIKARIYKHFDQAVKDGLGEGASIEKIVDDSGFPYQILAIVSIKTS